MTRALFHLNSAGGQGGALWIRLPNAEFVLSNSTVAINSASIVPSGGGGIYVHADTSGDGEVTSINNTIAGNLSGRDIVKMGDMTLSNTISASPDQDNCVVSIDNQFFTSQGNNISNDNSCQGVTLGSDMPDTDPMLGALANSGSNLLTFELLPGSPAIDAGNDLTCFLEPVDGVDQRGDARPQQGCDIGAHEQEADLDSLFSDRFEVNPDS